VVADRWLEAKTVDYSDLPQVCPPVGRAVVNRARRLSGGGQPPNLPAWPANDERRNARPDMPHDPRRRSGRWL
jgi:hypothetical protein